MTDDADKADIPRVTDQVEAMRESRAHGDLQPPQPPPPLTIEQVEEVVRRVVREELKASKE
jgi:hypothetical protein